MLPFPPVPDSAAPAGNPARPTLPTCPDCGGILEPAAAPWQTLMDALPPNRTSRPERETGRWQCLLCGWRKS